MKINEVGTKIKNDLYKKYIKDESKEWVYVEIISINRVDIDMVSDSIDDIDELKVYISSLIKNINEQLEDNIELYLGHLNLHSVDEAEFFDLQKPKERTFNNLSFSELIDAGVNNIKIINEEKINQSQIISFYSYKGGVGRTIALIQTAYLLAKEGKNVLLMDLDIEAPSFYNIFQDDIKSESGLVDYLYEQLYFNEKNIKINNIVSKLNLNLRGEIYIIPAGKNNKNYVKKLEKLKEKRIYENKLIQNIIKDADEKYGINYTLVDSRTGINNWGALSLIDISDEVMLFAYPNRENIDGIKLILELIEPYKTPTIVLSRIHDSLEGNKIAENLFSELETNQEFIPVHYESSIALAQKYPIENATKPFEKISKFIIQKENNSKYEKFIKNNKELAYKILDDLSNNNKIDNIVTTNEEKILSQNNWIIINDEENIKNIIRKVDKNIEIIDDVEIDEKIDIKLNHPIFKQIIVNVLYILNKMAIKRTTKYSINKQSEFRDYDISEFEKYINEKDNTSFIKNMIYFMNETFTEDITSNSVYIIYFENLLGYFNKGVDTDLDRKILEAFLLVFDTLTYPDSNLNLKLVIDKKHYQYYENEFNQYNSSILNLIWQENESSLEKIEEILKRTVNSLDDEIKKDISIKLNFRNDYNFNIDINDIEVESLYKSLNPISKNKLILDNKESKLNFNSIIKTKWEEVFNDMYLKTNNLDEVLLNLIYCSNIDKTRYSKLLNKWIYEELDRINKLNKQVVIDLIKSAVNIEKECSNVNKSSIITFESFKKAMNNIEKREF